jgi:hypothetical protein
MKKTVNTISISVRVPSTLSDWIDKAVDQSQMFNYRADFVLYATSRMMENIFNLTHDRFSKEFEELSADATDRVNELFETTKEELLKEGREAYGSFDGELVQILIRVPIGWAAYISEYTLTALGIQDFIRFSIVDLLLSGGIFVIENPYIYTMRLGFKDRKAVLMPIGLEKNNSFSVKKK